MEQNNQKINNENDIQFKDIKEYILDGAPYDHKNKPIALKDVILLGPNAYIKDAIKNFMNELATQKELIEYGLIPSRTVFLSGNPGLGKEQALTAKIYTPYGITTMGELKVGDIIFDGKGEKTKVLQLFPQGKKEIYRIYFNDNTFIEVGKEHLNQIFQYKTIKSYRINGKKKKIWGKKYQVLTTKELIDFFNQEQTKKKKYAIRVDLPILNYSRQKVEIDPYILGILLGDGCITTNKISFTNLDKDIIQRLNEYCKSIGDTLALQYDKRKSKNKQCQYRINGSNLVKKLEKLNLIGTNSETKFIPNEYLFNDYNTRLELIRGLMDTDGTVWSKETVKKDKTYKNCYFEYLTVSSQLSEGISHLLRSIGCVDIISIKKCFYYDKEGNKKQCKDGYRHRINIPNNVIPFYTKRKVKGIKPREFEPIRKIVKIENTHIKKESQCILVDSPEHTYITDNITVTHNTMLAKAVATRLNYPLYIVDVAGVLKDNGMEAIRKVFKFVANPKNQPCILFMDECDGIALSRENKAITNKNKAESNRVTNFIMQVLQEQNENFNSRLIIFAATNYMDAIDEAFLTRFQVQLYFYLPDDYIPFIEIEVRKNKMFELEYDVDPDIIKIVNTSASKAHFSIRALNAKVNQVFKQEIITRRKENRLTGDVIPIKLSSILQAIANEVKLGLDIKEVQESERDQEKEFNQIMQETENI